MVKIRFVIPALLAASLTQPALAQGPLADLLAAAPAFSATLLNLAANDARLDARISIDLAAPVLAPGTAYAIAGPSRADGPPPPDRPLPVSTITDLSTSATGVMQTGTIALTATHHWRDDPALAGAATNAETSAAPSSPVFSYTLANQGVNLGDVQAGMAVIAQNQRLDLSDQSASATGAMNTGQIRILISED